jgi:sugar phosphate isomerase/epimerase
MLGRREFCMLGAAGLLRASRHVPVALQLFSVRQQCDKDLPDTLSRVAQFGYEGVELAGYYGRKPAEFRKLLEEFRLPCCAAHVPFESLLGDELPVTIQFQRALGNRTLIVPGLPADAMKSQETWLSTARRFTEISRILHRHEMRLGYHNHAVEFSMLNGRRPWDTFFASSSKDVVIELDLGNAGYGGADPVAALKQFPGRARFVHVKDYTARNPDLMVGDGDMNWRDFFPVCDSIAGTDWFVIEHDSDPAANLADIADCLQRFRAKESQYYARRKRSG